MIEVNGCYVYIGKNTTIKLENDEAAQKFAIELTYKLIYEEEIML